MFIDKEIHYSMLDAELAEYHGFTVDPATFDPEKLVYFTVIFDRTLDPEKEGVLKAISQEGLTEEQALLVDLEAIPILYHCEFYKYWLENPVEATVPYANKLDLFTKTGKMAFVDNAICVFYHDEVGTFYYAVSPMTSIGEGQKYTNKRCSPTRTVLAVFTENLAIFVDTLTGKILELSKVIPADPSVVGSVETFESLHQDGYLMITEDTKSDTAWLYIYNLPTFTSTLPNISMINHGVFDYGEGILTSEKDLVSMSVDKYGEISSEIVRSTTTYEGNAASFVLTLELNNDYSFSSTAVKNAATSPLSIDISGNGVGTCSFPCVWDENQVNTTSKGAYSGKTTAVWDYSGLFRSGIFENFKVEISGSATADGTSNVHDLGGFGVDAVDHPDGYWPEYTHDSDMPFGGAVMLTDSLAGGANGISPPLAISGPLQFASFAHNTAEGILCVNFAFYVEALTVCPKKNPTSKDTRDTISSFFDAKTIQSGSLRGVLGEIREQYQLQYDEHGVPYYDGLSAQDYVESIFDPDNLIVSDIEKSVFESIISKQFRYTYGDELFTPGNGVSWGAGAVENLYRILTPSTFVIDVSKIDRSKYVFLDENEKPFT